MNKLKLKDIASTITSGSRGWAHYYADEGALFLRMTNLPKQGIRVLLHNNRYVQLPQNFNEGKRTSVKEGDILISITAELGKIGYVENLQFNEAYVNQHVCLVRLCPEKANSKFIAYYLSSNKQRNLLNRLNDAGAKSGLNLPTISNFPINLPDLNLQNFIVAALETWDMAIEKTEALITAKERQFDWLTNYLMVRSNKNWPSSILKNITQIKKGQQINRDTLDESGKYPVWNGGVTPSGYTDQYNTSENTITISEGGNSCGFVNFSEEKFWLGGHCYALERIVSEIFPDFLFFFLKAQEHYIRKLRVGSGLPNIQKKDIEKIEIKYPNFQEQKRIAKILNTAIQEIALLKQLAFHYNIKKRSLMQKLLSDQQHKKKI